MQARNLLAALNAIVIFCIRSDTRLHSIIAAGGSSAHGVHLAGVFDDLGYDLQCRPAV